jgi:hypothetical protein
MTDRSDGDRSRAIPSMGRRPYRLRVMEARPSGPAALRPQARGGPGHGGFQMSLVASGRQYLRDGEATDSPTRGPCSGRRRSAALARDDKLHMIVTTLS